MSNPESVPACIKALSSTTFVAEVTAPALAVLVPLLIRALNDRSMEVQRRTVVVIDNLVKLVRDPNVAAIYLSPLVEGTQKIAKGAAFPEVCICKFRLSTHCSFSVQVRAFGEAALETLLKSGASAAGPPATHRDIDGEKAEALSSLLTLLPTELVIASPSSPNGPPAPRHTSLKSSLELQAALIADLIHERRFSDKEIWQRCVGVYLTPWLDAEQSAAFAETVRSHFSAIDEVSYRTSFLLTTARYLLSG